MSQAKKSFAVSFVETLTVRNAEQFSKDTVTAMNNATSGSVAVDKVMQGEAFKEIQKTLLKNVRIASATVDKTNFVAVKVLVKIVQALTALGQGLPSQFDPYTRCILENLIALNGLSNKSALVSLSRSIEYDETEQVATLVKRYNCSANTAGTQASSTRMMLKHLDICEVSKGKRGDVIAFKDNDRARAVIALFANI